MDRSVDGPSVLMEGVRGEHGHHNQQKSDKEEDKGYFAILLYNYYNHTLLPVIFVTKVLFISAW